MPKKKKNSKTKKPAALIVGGTSGLGAELAQRMKKDFAVTVTGRTNGRGLKGIAFQRLGITHFASESANETDVLSMDAWDTVVYCAGYYQEGLIDAFHDQEIALMNNVCLTVPEMLVSRIVSRHDDLRQLVIVSSTSALTPRRMEPLYSAAKAGLHMLAHCLQEDERIGSVLLAAPCGMDTPFYDDAERDTSAFARAGDVAERIYSFMRERIQFTELRFERTPEKPFFKCWKERAIHTNPPVPYKT